MWKEEVYEKESITENNIVRLQKFFNTLVGPVWS